MNRPTRLSIGLLTLILSGCVNPPRQAGPPTDAWIFRTDRDPTPAIGNASLRGKSGRLYVVRGDDLSNFLSTFVAVSQKSGLAPQAGLIASDTPNAFATTNQDRQIVLLSIPMLEKIGTDRDALATTLGHEIAHLYLRHGEARQQRSDSARGISNVLGLALGIAGVPMSGSIASFGVSTVTAAYSRDEEREADILGLKWAMAAGYSACGSARTMQMLKSLSASSPLPFLSSHPGHDERIERANETSLKATGHSC